MVSCQSQGGGVCGVCPYGRSIYRVRLRNQYSSHAQDFTFSGGPVCEQKHFRSDVTEDSTQNPLNESLVSYSRPPDPLL